MSRTTSIGEIAALGALQFGDGYRTKRSEHGQPGYRIIRVADVMDDAVSFEGPDFVSADYVRAIGTKLGHPGDILLTTKGTVGRVAVLPETDEQVVYSPQLCYFRVLDSDVITPRFLRYWFSSQEFWNQAADRMNNTDMAAYINLADIRSLKLSLPEVSEQRAIAEVLGALDDKIAANTKLARTVEDILHASYLGLIAANPSHQVAVESLVHRITPNRKIAKDELLAKGDFPVFDQSEAGLLGYLNGDGFLEASAEHPILYFGDHTCRLGIAAQKFTVGPNTVPFKGSGIPSLTLYCALSGLQRHEEYKRHWQLLMKKVVSVPNAQSAAEFALQYGYLLSLLQTVSRESICLAATRDALLPQLMSGKLRVKDAEALVAAAV
ncbi:EcoKI restriction-modification system protein HsdS [Arthrobacter ulcerisalmonis]|uniref:EcoKI restriction-modification system protein HsdS n=1 Tax=Arthrobacter ulcerisalmonis TaxID=2483813 RepID=A0A3P5XEH5_9MICC|nr:restriction endonuclease subunit S [Arthrobacter ulcerisalmonis]VDC33132.1 EcoKI restriction-modification system protein HsdS [Arthrobacter ulcerisalmonis]